MDFSEWNKQYHRMNPAGMDVDTADRILIQMCQAMALEEKKGNWGSGTFGYGRVSADSFGMWGDNVVSFSAGRKGRDYAPLEREITQASTQASDFFALGMILYEMLQGSLPLSEDYERIWEEKKRLGKLSLLDEGDVNPQFRELGRLLRDLTCFSAIDRLQSLDELPNAEYNLFCTEIETGKVLKRSQGLLDFFDKKIPIPESLERDGKFYQCYPKQPQAIGYSFLKREYRIFYRMRTGDKNCQ